ncbi:3-keto-disaccharide hydrolase [Thalassoglobus sp.]|uniref:3-keto-disaccharide hydrolase n=1 Tax=Thalassoglobus sp. TaxID=2795869 RepID=UPI003AA97AFE
MKTSLSLLTVAIFISNQPFVLAADSACKKSDSEEGFVSLFDGKTLDGWVGAKETYKVEDGMIVSLADKSGNMVTEKEYSDFIIRFEFLLTPASNNGIGLRMPVKAHAATEGMEIQLLDEDDARYRKLKPYQFHGSVYGVIPAKKGHLKPLGEWNTQEIRCIGPQVTVILNGETIVDGNVVEAVKDGAMDEREHPGVLRTAGHIGLLGHKSVVKIRNLRVKEIVSDTASN